MEDMEQTDFFLPLHSHFSQIPENCENLWEFYS